MAQSITSALAEARLQWATQGGLHVVNLVRRDYLAGQVLARRTGTLARSVTASRRVLASRDGFEFGTNVKYGIAWEKGFTRPGYTVRPKKKKALAFQVGGKKIIVKKAVIPPRRFAARPFLGPALEAGKPYLLTLAETLYAGALKTALPDRTIRIL